MKNITKNWTRTHWGVCAFFVILAWIMGTGLRKAGAKVMATKVIDCRVKEINTITTADIDIWSVVRKTNRDDVPSCAFNIYDDGSYICTQRDTLGNCTKEEWEEAWDYNQWGWKDYKPYVKICPGYNCPFTIPRECVGNRFKFYNHRTRTELTLYDSGNDYEFKVKVSGKSFKINDELKVTVRQMTGNILKIVKL